MALATFEETFGKARVRRGDPRRINSDAVVREQFKDIFDAVQGVVDVMRDPNTGDRYRVAMTSDAGAATSEGEKVIKISWRPVFDRSLRVSTACTVMTGLVFHEVGHTLDTFPFLDSFRAVYGDERSPRTGWDPIKRAYGRSFDALAFTVLNIVEDKRLEYRQARRYPVCRDVFPTMLHWVALTTGMVGNVVAWDESRTKQGMVARVNFVTFATRYPWTARWSKDAVTRAERLWWQDWSNAYALLDDEQVEERLAAIAVALTALRSPEREEPEPGDEPTDIVDEEPTGPGGDEDGPSNPTDDFDNDDDDDSDEDGGNDDDGEDDGPGGSDDDDEDGGTQGGTDFADDEYDDEPEPGDEDGEGNPGGSSDEPPEGWDDEPGDAEGEDEGDGGSGESDDTTPTGEPTDTDGEGTGKGNPGGDAPTEEPEAEPKPEAERITDDYDSTTSTGVDAVNRGEKDDYKQREVARTLDNIVNTERTIERLPTDKWGTAAIKPVTMADRFGR